MRERAGVQTTSPFLFWRQHREARRTDEFRISRPGKPADHLQTRHVAGRAGVAVAHGCVAGGARGRDVLSTDAHLRRGVRQAEFLVLSILAATFTLAVLPPRNPTRQIISGRLELATNLLLRWAVLVAALLALGYVTKFSEDFSRRVVVTWVLVTPVLLVMLSLVLHGVTRALLRDAAQARRAVIVGCTQASMELAKRLGLHVELGISVAGLLRRSRQRPARLLRACAAARPLRRRRRVREQPQHRRDLHRDPAGPGGARARAGARARRHHRVHLLPARRVRLRHDPAARQRDSRHAGGGDVRDAVPRLSRPHQAPHGRHHRELRAGAARRRCC